MHFKYVYSEQGLLLSDEAELCFTHAATGMLVLMRRATPEEIASGHDAQKSFCVAQIEKEPSAKILTMFEHLLKAELPPGWIKAEGWESWIDADGKYKNCSIVHERFLPQSFSDFLRQQRESAHTSITAAIKAVRWRHNVPGPHNSFGSVVAQWSSDGKQWNALPVSHNAKVSFTVGFQPTKNEVEEISIIANGAGEPVGHELFREAWQNLRLNPRSALVIGMAAVEIGIKECLIDLVPDAKWLIENVPSPPVESLLRDGLSKLPLRQSLPGKYPFEAKSVLLEAIKKGVRLRNEVAHRATSQPKTESIEEILLAVRDILWLLDYFRGNGWAIKYVRAESLA